MPTAQVKMAFYRIAQEVLNNEAEHSGASQTIVSLRCEPDKIELIVEDNGQGFDARKSSPGSLGLAIMQERAKSIGAYLNITRQPGRCTTVTVIWQKKQGRDMND